MNLIFFNMDSLFVSSHCSLLFIFMIVLSGAPLQDYSVERSEPQVEFNQAFL